MRFQPIGYRAYYPSKAFPVHEELGGRDLINEVSRECRKAGVHLYCYTGYGAPMMDVDLMREQPQFADWILRDPEGKPYGTWSEYTIRYSTYLCIQGDAYRQGIRGVTRELSEHDIDGVYFDAPSDYRGVCFCETCRRNFKKYTGMDLDRLRNLPSHANLNDALDLEGLPNDVDMKVLIAWYDWANKTDAGGPAGFPQNHPRQRKVHALPQRRNLASRVALQPEPGPRRVYGRV